MWFLLILAILAVLLILLLMIPLTLQLHLQRNDTVFWQISVVWFFGLLRTRFEKKSSDQAVQKEQQISQEDKPARKNTLRPILAALGTRGFPHALARFLTKSWSGLHWRAWSLKTGFGFPDPADTGIAFGLLSASFPLAAPFCSRFRIEPDFDEPGLEFNLQGTVEVFPLKFGATLLISLAKPATIRAFIAFIRARK